MSICRIRMMQTAGTIHQTETARHAASLDGVIIRTSAGSLDSCHRESAAHLDSIILQSAGDLDGTETQPETVAPSKQRRKADHAQEAHRKPHKPHRAPEPMHPYNRQISHRNTHTANRKPHRERRKPYGRPEAMQTNKRTQGQPEAMQNAHPLFFSKMQTASESAENLITADPAELPRILSQHIRRHPQAVKAYQEPTTAGNR